MDEESFMVIIFIALLILFGVITGGAANQMTNNAWQRDLAKSGHARYVINQTTGESTWQLLPPATQPRTAGDAEGGK